MQAQTIVIGDELLIGQVTDTNSGMIARLMNQIGIDITRTTVIPDDAAVITQTLDNALSQVDIVFITGGLGPTKDDITKRTLTDYFCTYLVEDLTVKAHIEQLYHDRPQVFNALTATQWQVPKDCHILPNRVGSAPIMYFCRDGKKVFSMPGVPYEAEIAVTEQILPILQQSVTDQILHKTIIVSGIPESALALRIASWEESLPEYMHLAYLPAYRMIRLRLTGKTPLDFPLDEQMNCQLNLLRPLIQDYIIAEKDAPLEVLVGEYLTLHHATIATAESCTGGRLAALLNKHSGSSAFYMGSVVAYDNRIKQQVLGVSPQNLEQYGAVSEQVVCEMAQGAKRLLGVDYALATSGIAGPTGGTKEKPVGTVWIALATPQQTIAQCFHFGNNREQNTARAASMALAMFLQNV